MKTDFSQTAVGHPTDKIMVQECTPLLLTIID